MSLKKLFETEFKAKKKEVFNKFKKKINLATPDAKEKAVKIYTAELLKERADTFIQKTEPGDPYFYLDDFTREYFDHFHGLYNDFDLEFKEAKQKVLDRYKEHDFLPSIKIFFKQSDEEIITKIAHYKAYWTAWEKLEKWGNEILEKYNPTNNNFAGAGNYNSRKIDQLEFAKLFNKPEYCKKVNSIIKSEFLDNSGKWRGLGKKLQEIGALVDALERQGYIYFSNKTEAVQIFCNKYSMTMSERTARSTGIAYDKFYQRCISLFPKVS